MQIGAKHIPVDASLRRSIFQHAKRRAADFRPPVVNLVTRQPCPAEQFALCDRAHLHAPLLRVEHRPRRQKTQPGKRHRPAALRALRIVKRLPQHLVAAAYAEYRRARVRQLERRRFQPVLPQPEQILHRVFRARQNHQIGPPQLPRPLHIADAEQLVLLQRHEIREIADVRQADDRRIQRLNHAIRVQPFGKRILVLDLHVQIRHNAQNGQARLFLQHRQAGPQNLHVAAELVDNQTRNARALLLFKQRHRAVKLGEHATPVDVARQQHRRIHQLCQPHVDDVVRLEVDFRRAARALDDDDVHILAQAVERGENIGNELPLHLEIVCRAHLPAHLAAHDHLTARVAARLEQNRVHAHVRLDARRLSLHDLCAPHFQPVAGDKTVERHVLALERRDTVSVLRKNAAQRRTEQALARAAHRPLHHDPLRSAHAIASRSAARSASFSRRVRTAVLYQLSSSPG